MAALPVPPAAAAAAVAAAAVTEDEEVVLDDSGDWFDVSLRKGKAGELVVVKRAKLKWSTVAEALDRDAKVLAAINAAVPLPVRAHLPTFLAYEGGVLVMGYVRGRQLREFLADGDGHAVTASVLYDIVRQVCETLAALQSAFPGFRHRDLHAGNGLVATDPVHASIIDFGDAGQLAAARGPLPAVDAAAAPVAADVLHLCECMLTYLPKGSARHWLAQFCARISTVGTDVYSDPARYVSAEEASVRCKRAHTCMADVLRALEQVSPEAVSRAATSGYWPCCIRRCRRL